MYFSEQPPRSNTSLFSPFRATLNSHIPFLTLISIHNRRVKTQRMPIRSSCGFIVFMFYCTHRENASVFSVSFDHTSLVLAYRFQFSIEPCRPNIFSTRMLMLHCFLITVFTETILSKVSSKMIPLEYIPLLVTIHITPLRHYVQNS